jgi:hypothetical protein
MQSCKTFLLPLFLFVNVSIFAQSKTVSYINQVWAGYYSQTRLSDKWGVWLDGQMRTQEDFTNNLSVGIIRVGAIYYLNNNCRLTTGYAFVNNYPAEKHSMISQIEHRPWQQIQWTTDYNYGKMSQSVRLEQRFTRNILNDSTLADSYKFNYRLRYHLSYQIPLNRKVFSKNTLALIVSDDVHFNLGKSIVNNLFDQNRLFCGIGYYLNSNDYLQFGYMNVFQQQVQAGFFKNTNVIRAALFQNLNWRHK